MDKRRTAILSVTVLSLLVSCGKQNSPSQLSLGSEFGITMSTSPSSVSRDQYNSVSITKEKSKVNLNGNILDGTANNILITGTEVVIDVSQDPFRGYNKDLAEENNIANSIYSLTIDAKKIVVRNHLKLRQTNVVLNAEQIIFEENGVIETTPKQKNTTHETLGQRLNGHDGIEGLPGSQIQIVANEILIEGDQTKKRLIARGGLGQAAGGGRNGIDGVSIPAFETVALGGVSYGVVYRENLFETPSCNPDILKTHDEVTTLRMKNCVGGGSKPERGAKQWPTDGEDAIPGGHPGPGGVGGRILIQAKSINNSDIMTFNLSEIADVAAGVAGTPAGDYLGGKAGQPQYAAMWTVQNNYTPDPRYVLVPNKTTRDGKGANSPRTPLKVNPAGTIKSEIITSLAHTESFYKSRLKLIRDKYIEKDFSFVKNTLDADLKEMRSLFPIYATQYSEVHAHYALLLNRITLQQDYFGHSYKEAPLYTLDFSLNQFDSEIEMALTNYYLTTKVLALLKSEQLTRDQLVALMKEHNKTINSESEKQNIRVAKINELEGMRLSLKNSEEAYDRLLQALNRQIEEQAQRNVAQKHKWDAIRQNIKVLASLAKVIPAGQPTLAAAGTVMEYISDIPTSGSVADYIAYGSKAKSDWEKAFSQDNLTKSRISFDSFIDKLRTSNLDNKNLQEKVEYIQNLKKELGPVHEKITEISKGLTGSIVPANELQEEIEKIRKSDSLFQTVTTELEKIVKQRAEVYSAMQEIFQDLTKSAALIEQSIALSLATQDQYIGLAKFGDSTLRDLVKSIQDLSKERLLYVHNEVIKAYEYTTLESLPESSHFELLKEKTMAFASSNGSLEESIHLLKSFYMSFIYKVVVSLDTKFHSGSPSMFVKKDSVYIDLTEKQVRELNVVGTTKLYLNKSVFGDHQKNLRIANIEIDRTQFAETTQGSEGIQKTFIEVSHSGSGELEDAHGTFHPFTYQTSNGLYAWGASYQFMGSEVIESQLIRDESMKGILGLLLKDKANSLVYSPIFSQPAALTTMYIGKRDHGGTFPLENMRIKITYTFF
ncbi:hypothetical protein [Bdellovibrio sp.]|uniref:hypothetical protein n=1 Tax=Bdellovibrio sp. TaxID=28201 RepID=UPI0039E2B35F